MTKLFDGISQIKHSLKIQIVISLFLICMFGLALPFFSHTQVINSRADELFANPMLNVSSLQASFDRVNYGEGKFYNTYLVRGLYTLKNNRMNIRLDLPLASANPESNTITGLGDISARMGFLVKQHGRTIYGVRTNLKFPTASSGALGTGKFIFEPSAGLVHFLKDAKGTVTFGIEYTQSYAGKKEREDIQTIGIVANADWWFKRGYLGYYPTFRYNIRTSEWNVPLDVEFGYMFVKNWWVAAEYIVPLVHPKYFNNEWTLKIKRMIIRQVM